MGKNERTRKAGGVMRERIQEANKKKGKVVKKPKPVVENYSEEKKEAVEGLVKVLSEINEEKLQKEPAKKK